MTGRELNDEYARQLTAMAVSPPEHEIPHVLRWMARETERRDGAELPAPRPGAEIVVWADLHFDEDRMRRATNRPWPAVDRMNRALSRSWYEAMTPGTVMVCAGDMGGGSRIFGRRRPSCADLPGPWHAVLGNHDFTRFLLRENRLGAGSTSMTLVIRSDPPLLVTHVPLAEVPRGCVNVHGHEHTFKPLKRGRWINVSVEQTEYRPLDVRTEVIPLAKVLIAGWIPPGETTAERIRHVPLAGLY
ncbi:MAG: hypothetical protein OXG35_25130 [Acidobacteria bacterium]|nr:hypothetical protein [Acidobacteriota bacterium]